jgi:hypothetical protein
MSLRLVNRRPTQNLAPNRLGLGARKFHFTFALGRENPALGVTVAANGGRYLIDCHARR